MTNHDVLHLQKLTGWRVFFGDSLWTVGDHAVAFWCAVLRTSLANRLLSFESTPQSC